MNFIDQILDILTLYKSGNCINNIYIIPKVFKHILDNSGGISEIVWDNFGELDFFASRHTWLRCSHPICMLRTCCDCVIALNWKDTWSSVWFYQSNTHERSKYLTLIMVKCYPFFTCVRYMVFSLLKYAGALTCFWTIWNSFPHMNEICFLRPPDIFSSNGVTPMCYDHHL